MDTRRLLPLLLLLVALVAWGGGGAVAAEDPAPVPPGYARVPDLHRLEPERAARKLADARLNIGRVFEVQVPARWRPGLVIQQAPPPGTILRQGFPVHIRVSAQATGPAEGREAPRHWPRAAVPFRNQTPLSTPPAPPEGAAPSAVPGAVPGPAPRAVPRPVPRQPPGRPLPAPLIADPRASSVPPAVPVPDEDGNLVPPAVPVPAEDLGAVPPGVFEASGSPDAPRDAPAADPNRVPGLLGLPLADAEHLARASGMSLYVERVAGHPVGRILEQAPAPGSARPPAGAVRVVVAAGGDHLADLAPPPLVAVPEIAVPDLLDRTGPQAQRILEDLGLQCDVRPALRGPPGRVADQAPAAGSVLPKGATVVVKVAPGGGRRPTGPSPAAPAAGTPPPATPAPAPGHPGAPLPLAPASGTALGSEATLAVGFTWRPVAGAEAYVIEVEERGASGWVANARQVSRQGAVILQVLRLSDPPGVLRWRVRAVTKGRHGPPSPWVVLR